MVKLWNSYADRTPGRRSGPLACTVGEFSDVVDVGGEGSRVSVRPTASPDRLLSNTSQCLPLALQTA